MSKSQEKRLEIQRAAEGYPCPKCGTIIKPGMWPYCGRKTVGPEEHGKQTGGWHFK